LSRSCTAPAECSPAISTVELRLGLALARLEAVVGLPERQSLEVERPSGADVVTAARSPQHLDAENARRIVGCGERVRRLDPALHDRDGPLVGEAGEGCDEIGGVADIDAIRKPHDLDVGCRRQEPFQRRHNFGALDRVRLRLDEPQPRSRRGSGLERNVARRGRQRHHGNAAAIGVGTADEVLGGAQAGIPARRGRKAVIDEEHERHAGAGRRDRRIPQRPGRGDDDQRRKRQPQHGQPPRRARRRLLLGHDVEQHAGRRKFDAARPRRDEAQQPPQHRQAEQAEQDERLGKCEGDGGDHGCCSIWSAVERCPATPRSLPNRS
jgi:hypothetical protein